MAEPSLSEQLREYFRNLRARDATPEQTPRLAQQVNQQTDTEIRRQQQRMVL